MGRMIRSSERSDFKRCPQRWWWRWREGLVPMSYSTGPLWLGTGGHLAFAGWFIPGSKRGVDPRETWDAYAKDSMATMKVEKVLDDEIEESFEDTVKLVHDLFTAYLKEFGKEEHIEVLAPEQRFQVLIPSPRNPDKAITKLLGSIDLIGRNHEEYGRIELWDHKFLKSINNTGYLIIDDQNGGYLSVATSVLRQMDMIAQNESVKGLMYNMLRKGKVDERPQDSEGYYLNKDLTRSKNQGTPLFRKHWVSKTPKERRSQIKHIGEEALVMRKFEKGELPLYKAPKWTCQWDCDFFDMCKIHEQGGDVQGMKDLAFKVTDPYEDHRENAINSKTIIPGVLNG